jgi:4-hydroxybenzoate polyprenyltransferase
MFDKLGLYLRLTRMDRPIGWLLLLWPTLWGVWIAGEGSPRPVVVAIFIAGVIVMRAAGCIVNDYLDRDLDRHVARTRNRPFATGEISGREGAILFAVLITIALGLVLTLNRLTLLLAIVGVVLTLTYPLFKRFTHLPQLYLGIVFSWGIPMAFAAQQDTLPMIAWTLLFANLLWTVAYDTMYAMSDRSDDQQVGIKSTAILIGRHDLIFNAAFQAAALIVMLFVGLTLEFGVWFYAGLLAAGGAAIYQNRLCKDRDRHLCFKAFLNNTWFGAAIFAGIVMAYLTKA